MTPESLTMWIALALYAVGAIGLLYGFVFGKPSAVRAGLLASIVAFASHTASIAVRLAVSGRLPVQADYENAMAGSWMIMAVFLTVAAARPKLRVAGAVVIPIVLLTAGFGATAPSAAQPLTPAYKSGWLAVHVTFAWITYACYTCAAALAAFTLLEALPGSALTARARRVLPAGIEAEDLTLRLVTLGFVNNAIMIASGAIWAYRLWGSYWSWDPVETWSLLTWLAFGLYLHLKLTFRWSGARLAWVAVAGLFGVLMAFWGVQLFPSTYHLFREIGAARPGG